MDFVFMLTREDQTVADCLEVVEEIADLGLAHIGFKDVGIAPEALAELHAAVKATGATSYLEVVSVTERQALASAATAAALGVDVLLGGTWVSQTLAVLEGSATRYLPFPGVPTGHPTVLGGSPRRVAADCRAFETAGCAGADLLAYRASEAPPLELVRAARAALRGTLLVAGSVQSARQLADLADAGVDAFTIGSAVFDGSIDRRSGLLRSQLRAVERMLA